MNEQTISNILAILNQYGVQSAIKEMDYIGKRSENSSCRYGSLLRKFAVSCVEQCKHLVNHRDLLNAISIANEFAHSKVRLTVVEKTRLRAKNAAQEIDEIYEASEISNAAEACANVLLGDAYLSAYRVQQNVRFALAHETARNAIARKLAESSKLDKATVDKMQYVEWETAIESVKLMIKGLLRQILEAELAKNIE